VPQLEWAAKADLRRLLAIETPIVAIDDRRAHPSLTSVASADDQGIRDAVMHLAALGRRRLAMLAGLTHIPCPRDRLTAFRSAVTDTDLVVDPKIQLIASEDSFGRVSLRLPSSWRAAWIWTGW